MNANQPETDLADLTTAWTAWFREMSLRICTDGGENDGGFDENRDGWYEGRQTGYLLGKFLSVRCWSERLGLDPAEVDSVIRRSTAFICHRQSPDGRMDLGGAYSHNEVGFTLPALAEGYRRISELPGNPLEDVAASLKTYLLLGAEAVLKGDAHTANHRWTAAAAPLAAVHSLWPDDRYLRKIEDYLSDGFDLNKEGCWYEERSPNYNIVANNGVLVLADCLNRPELLDLVRRSLDFAILFLQPNGEADASFSHRQDRGAAHRKAVSYAQARRIALSTGEGRYAALARLAWNQGDRGQEDLMPILFEWDQRPGALPAEEPLPTEFERMLPATGLARVRRGKTALTLACDEGNHFYDTVLQSWGGPRLSDDWFHLHHGEIVLQTIHLSGGCLSNNQPRFLRQPEPGRYVLGGEVAGWNHTLHFRPGRPQTFMEWKWKHEVDVLVRADAIDLSVQSTAGSSLMASLCFWIRPGAEIWEGERSLGRTEAGKRTALQGGLPVTLRQDESEVRITGLPVAKHRRLLDNGPSIPSGIASQCGAFFVGLVFPVDLSLQIQLIK
jgi:hypothetical protein